jgi:aspartyl-tRNA(Asn)/glutamyl-tRNA(Gln) amidotransferase subunit A
VPRFIAVFYCRLFEVEAFLRVRDAEMAIIKSEFASESSDFPASSFKTVTQIHDAFDRGEVTPLQLTQTFFEEEKRRRTLNTFISLCEARAFEQARFATDHLAREGRVPRESKPLFGIPIGIKDNLALQGVRTTCASRMLENYVPPYTATAVERLEGAGAITLGKLNLDEFAMGGSNENSAMGAVRHPTHPERVPGGSSGGSAAAVRAGLCFAALGSDTGGSIRLPASYCGIVGLKPSYGRVSRSGLVAFASSLDQIGPMTRSVEDAALFLEVMAGSDPRDGTCANLPVGKYHAAARKSVDWNSLRIGVPQEYFSSGLNPQVGDAVQKSLQWMENQGAKLVSISLPHSIYSVSVYYLVAVSEASSNLSRFDGVRFGVRPAAAAEARSLDAFYEGVRSLFGAEVKRRIILGTFALSAGYSRDYYERACLVRRLIQSDFEKAFTSVDLIVGPVAPTTAYRLGEQITDPIQMYLNDLYTIPANLAGLPALSVPCGVDADGLPIGLQLMTPAFTEERLISVSASFERRGG